MASDLTDPGPEDLVGPYTDWIEAPHPIELGEIRRFVQAAGNPQPELRAEPDGRLLAPRGFIVHMFRRPLDDTADPLDESGGDGAGATIHRLHPDLPPIRSPLARAVNGGYDHEFYSCARLGERVMRRSRYAQIYQRQGSAGPLVFVVAEDEYRTADERPLQTTSNTHILRG